MPIVIDEAQLKIDEISLSRRDLLENPLDDAKQIARDMLLSIYEWCPASESRDKSVRSLLSCVKFQRDAIELDEELREDED